MHHFQHWERKGKKKQIIIVGFGKRTDARIEETKDWSVNNLLMFDWSAESLVLSCTDNWRAATTE